MKNVVLLVILVYSTIISAQVGGESIYNFLNIASSSKQSALGGKVYTLYSDVNQPVWNPSVLNESMSNNLSVNYVNYLADINLGSVSYARKINDKIGTLYSNITYLNYGEFVEADEMGNETGTFKAYDFAFTLGYSYKIPNSNFQVGTNVRFINSVIQDYSSFGIASDLALLYYNSEKPFLFTLVARNMGHQMTTYDEVRENLPFELVLGFSYKLENVPIKWHFTVDNLQEWDISESNPSNSVTDIEGNITEEKIGFFDNTIRHFSIGAELFYDSGFNINLGYNFRRAKELFLIDKRTFAGISAGFGIKMKKFKFNYAFTKYHPASNASTFSLLINFD